MKWFSLIFPPYFHICPFWVLWECHQLTLHFCIFRKKYSNVAVKSWHCSPLTKRVTSSNYKICDCREGQRCDVPKSFGASGGRSTLFLKWGRDINYYRYPFVHKFLSNEEKCKLFCPHLETINFHILYASSVLRWRLSASRVSFSYPLLLACKRSSRRWCRQAEDNALYSNIRW